MTSTDDTTKDDLSADDLNHLMSEWQIILFKDTLVQLRVVPFRNSMYATLRRFK
jgi:hypothetical protein